MPYHPLNPPPPNTPPPRFAPLPPRRSHSVQIPNREVEDLIISLAKPVAIPVSPSRGRLVRYATSGPGAGIGGAAPVDNPAPQLQVS